MNDNQQRAVDAIAWDDPRPAVVGGEWRANLADRVTAALDAAEARGRAEERDRWITALGMLAGRHDMRWFAVELRNLLAEEGR